MTRYFVAIPFSDQVCQRLEAVQPRAITGLRLVDSQQFHLTLHFVGELDAETVEAVKVALESVAAGSFEMTIHGAGVFPTKARPTVLWAGVDAVPGLWKLYELIGQVLRDAIGLEIEKRAYTPHITLARIHQPMPRGLIEDYLSKNQELLIPEIPIRQFVFYSSTPAFGMAKYHNEAVYRLG